MVGHAGWLGSLALLGLLVSPMAWAPGAPESGPSSEGAKPAPPGKLPSPGRTHAQGQRPQANQWKSRLPAYTPEREAAALAFVGAHHPELGHLLSQLKEMRRAEYETAVRELFQTCEMLAELGQRDADRAAAALAAWKTKSRIELVLARLADTPSAELEKQLRELMREQIDNEIAERRLDRQRALDRLQKSESALERLEQQRDQISDQRFHELIARYRSARKNSSPKTKGTVAENELAAPAAGKR